MLLTKFKNNTMKLSTIFLSLTLIACNSILEDKSQLIEIKPSINQLTKIELPLTSRCGASLPVYDQDRIQTIIAELPKNLRFGGLLKNTENYSAIILLDTYADEQIHFLATVNRDGKIIAKFELFSNGCHEDEFFWGQANYTILEDLKILQADTSATYKRTEDGEIIKETIVSSSHRFEYYVDKDGRIKKAGL
jgi:hypothetical protein